MNILIVGKSGFGKSNLGDLIKSQVFKLDPDATINSSDPDREIKTFGNGPNPYNISVKQLKESETVENIEKEVLDQADLIIYINNTQFHKWFREIYNK